MESKIPKALNENALSVANKLMEIYWAPMYKYLEKNPQLIPNVTGFLVKFDRLIFYFGKTHLAIEYLGPERINDLGGYREIEFQYFDYTESTENFFEQIVGFKFDTTTPMEFPLPNFVEDLIIPTNRGMDKLVELGWNFDAQNSLMAFNAGNFIIEKNRPARFINSLFFDADEKGLKTRHIKWIDFVPLEYDNTNDQYDSMSINLNYYVNAFQQDAEYLYPLPNKKDYKYSKLPQLNRLIELIGNNNTTEPEITTFLEKEENEFILSMAFLSKKIYPQIICEWQSENKNSIKPDFFFVHPNGYAHIVEFKLPHLKTNSVTGRTNRESFSAEINSYISQTRNYKTYFEDPNNRVWVEQKYGFKVLYPKRILVIGRRWDFDNDHWKEIINDYKDIEIMTYDDLVDGVTAQLYL